MTVVAMPSSPDLVELEAEVAAPEAERRVRALFHPRLPDHLCRVLAQDDLASIRSALLTRADLSADLVYQLSQDREPSVRRKVASRPRPISNAVREILAEDPVASVREGLAGRPDLDASFVVRLASDEDPVVRCMVASRVDLPLELLERLCSDDVELVRRHAAARTDLSPKIVSALAQDESEWVRAAIARNPFLDEATARELGQDPASRVRATIADSHPYAASDGRRRQR